MEEMMKQAIMLKPGEIEIRQTQRPEPGPGEVLLKIHRIGVCGSDVHVFHGKHPYTSYPVIQGHEFSATVEALGAGVDDVELQSKVTSMPQLVCGLCAPCLRGDYHICDTLKVQGFQAPGCAQEYWLTTADKIIPLPEQFSFEQGALVEPVAVAVHSTSRAGDMNGKNVAVLGAGPIGNLVAQVARANGARVLITDISDHRLKIAQECGLEHTSNAQNETLQAAAKRVFGDEGFSIALECVGVEATMTAVVEGIAKGGTIIVVGVFGEKPRIDMGLVQDRELNLRGTLMYQRPDYERAVQLIESGDVITEPLMSKHFSFDEYLDAYRFIDEQRDMSMKVFIDISTGEA
jgi:2-desacetyl-2-hydroxyethyl bacteriochlorophyllide A dehydrogenase